MKREFLYKSRLWNPGSGFGIQNTNLDPRLRGDDREGAG